MNGKIDDRLPMDKKIIAFGNLNLMFPDIFFQFRNIPEDCGMIRLAHDNPDLDFDFFATAEIIEMLKNVFGEQVAMNIYTMYDGSLEMEVRE